MNCNVCSNVVDGYQLQDQLDVLGASGVQSVREYINKPLLQLQEGIPAEQQRISQPTLPHIKIKYFPTRDISHAQIEGIGLFSTNWMSALPLVRDDEQ